MNIVLIGYRGAGKSAVGRRLALRLRRGFVDTDDLIEERLGARISEIVRVHGWEHFRAKEKRIVQDISEQDHLVIASGGGVVLDEGNIRALRRKGIIVWLKADREVLLERMEKDSQTSSRRPALTGKGVLEEFEEVMAYRQPFYERAAEVEVDTSSLNIEAVAEKILSILRRSRKVKDGRKFLRNTL